MGNSLIEKLDIQLYLRFFVTGKHIVLFGICRRKKQRQENVIPVAALLKPLSIQVKKERCSEEREQLGEEGIASALWFHYRVVVVLNPYNHCAFCSQQSCLICAASAS